MTVRVIGRVYRVISEAYPSTARSRINLVQIISVMKCFIIPSYVLLWFDIQ